MFTLAIIGFGPRGLHALESLLILYAQRPDLVLPKIVIFNDSHFLGAGAVWNPDQNEGNWSNISNQHLSELKGRNEISFKNFTIHRFPSYQEWLRKEKQYIEPNHYDFSRRSVIGTYLHARSESILSPLQKFGDMILYTSKVIDIKCDKKYVQIFSENDKTIEVDECLITVGHQKSKDSSETTKWKKLSKKHQLCFIPNNYNEDLVASLHINQAIAVKGFGLSFIDLMRFLLKKANGSFNRNSKGLTVTFSSPETSDFTIIPFSLDGLPPVPKPFSQRIDTFFQPNEQCKDDFKNFINYHQKNEDIYTLLIKRISEITTDIFISNNSLFRKTNLSKHELTKISMNWLKDMSYKHQLILDIDMNKLDYMKYTVQMSYATTEISLDYLIGQVWRHLQPILYAAFSHKSVSAENMEKIVTLDESTKRYSFGPPVASIEQIVALVEHKIIDLSYVEDPEVIIDSNGWNIRKEGRNTTSKIMIDTILSSPLAKDISSNLFLNLLRKNYIQPFSENLGVDVDVFGKSLSDHSGSQKIFLIGRYCKGSVLGVDAILECFGKSSEKWAEGFVQRRLHQKLQ